MVNKKANQVVKMEFMNIVVCDDEALFVDRLEREIKLYIAKKDLTCQIRKFRRSRDLLAADLSDCHVLFLDIDMPEINGIDTARELRQNYPDLILIFVTGWIEYAPAGYRVNAFRYLLKKQLPEELWSCLDEVREKLAENAETILVHTRDCNLEVAVRSILYFEGTPRRSVLLYLKQPSAPIECSGKLADYEADLAEKGFLRLQKSYLANMDNIVKIRNYQAVLQNGVALKVSERQYAQVCQKFLMWRKRIG